METSQDIKETLFSASQDLLKAQIKDIQKQLIDLQESSESEEKSSAGDKYETHQEMLNQSRNMLHQALEKNKLMLAQLNAISTKKMDKVEEGALVKLNIGTLWVSIALGQISLDGTTYHLVSKDSPLISTILGLKEKETYTFKGRTGEVMEVK
ncbi:MAG: hypothetical protein ACXIUQ_10105 [Cecembia sp.]